MDFEGLHIEGADDIIDHIRAGTATRIRDAQPWGWVRRLARSSVAARNLVEKALVRIIEEEAGDDLRPTPLLHEMFGLASRCGVRMQLDIVRAHVVSSLERWSNDEVETLLGWLFDARPEGLTPPELRAVIQHGRRPGCFAAALRVLRFASPEMAARFASDHVTEAWRQSERPEWTTHVFAELWAGAGFAPYRLEMLRALVAAPVELRERIRRDIEWQASYSMDLSWVRRQIECAWSPSCTPGARIDLFAQGLVKTFLQACMNRRPGVVHALLARPRATLATGQAPAAPPPAGDALVAALMEELALLESIDEIGEPVSLEQAAAGAPLALIHVPVVLRVGGRRVEQRIDVCRMGERLYIERVDARDSGTKDEGQDAAEQEVGSGAACGAAEPAADSASAGVRAA